MLDGGTVDITVSIDVSFAVFVSVVAGSMDITIGTSPPIFVVVAIFERRIE
jgi:hypothetical protein